jgi:DNA-binding response OmpR family regulator
MDINSKPETETSRILIVEDHIDLGFILRMAVERAGYLAESATSCREALDLMAAKNFDILVCDIMLPDGSGWEIIESWNSQKKRPAIAMSAMETGVGSAISFEKGFDRYLPKPFDLPLLIAEIKSLLNVES